MFSENFISITKRIIIGGIAIFCAITFGIVQSLDILKLFSYLRSNLQLRVILESCLMVNAVFFCSLWLTSVIFSPILNISQVFTWNGVSAADNVGIGFVSKLWFPVFDVMWVLPVYAITQGLGVRWYSALYTEAYSEKKRRASLNININSGNNNKNTGTSLINSPVDNPRNNSNIIEQEIRRRGSDIINTSNLPPAADTSSSFHTVVVSLSELMFKALVTAVYALAAAIVGIILPSPLGECLQFMMNSWLYAFYVFDYRFSSQYVFDRRAHRYVHVTLSETLKLFEKHWAYFLGFGVTQSIISNALRSAFIASSSFYIAAVISVLFGAHVVLSVEATPGPRVPFSVPMLTPFFAICGMGLRRIVDAVF